MNRCLGFLFRFTDLIRFYNPGFARVFETMDNVWQLLKKFMQNVDSLKIHYWVIFQSNSEISVMFFNLVWVLIKYTCRL